MANNRSCRSCPEVLPDISEADYAELCKFEEAVIRWRRFGRIPTTALNQYLDVRVH